MYLTKNSGGLDIVNIEYKLYALRLKIGYLLCQIALFV
jgi:ABC-type proline/glycine betaine transport system ATPase subunit